MNPTEKAVLVAYLGRLEDLAAQLEDLEREMKEVLVGPEPKRPSRSVRYIPILGECK